jgi:nucleoside-diphosphate-sugar epimerase
MVVPAEPVTLVGTRALVSGGTGQIGRHLVNALLARGATVAVLTRAPANARRLFGSRVEIRHADLCASGGLGSNITNVDVVFHLASFSPTRSRGSIYEDPRHWDVTVNGTRNLVEACIASGCRRLVYFSSIKAMGEDAGGHGKAEDESLPASPTTLYGKAKLEAENIIVNAADTSGIQATILRLPMVYGLEGSGNLSKMLVAIARHRFPPVPKVSNRRSAVHASDAVGAALLSSLRTGPSSRVYLVTDGNGYSTRWIYETMCTALGITVPSWSLPLWSWRLFGVVGSLAERLLGRTMPVSRDTVQKLFGNAWFSTDRIRCELGYQPGHELEAEIRRMASRYWNRPTEPLS